MANNEFLSKWLAKLKNVKHIEVYAVILLAVVVLAIWLIPTGDTRATSIDTSKYTTTEEYAHSLETRLNNVLSAISGAGSVQCMVTLDGEVERVLAYSNDEQNSSTSNTTSNGTTNKTESSTSNKEPILINVNGSSEPLVLYEIMPDIKGIVIVASGAGDVRVKLDILKAVQALLNVQSSQVEIFVSGNN